MSTTTRRRIRLYLDMFCSFYGPYSSRSPCVTRGMRNRCTAVVKAARYRYRAAAATFTTLRDLLVLAASRDVGGGFADATCRRRQVTRYHVVSIPFQRIINARGYLPARPPRRVARVTIYSASSADHARHRTQSRSRRRRAPVRLSRAARPIAHARNERTANGCRLSSALFI